MGVKRIRLNYFQRRMLRWEAIHPYNAVHAVRTAGPARLDALRKAITAVCAEAGIGQAKVRRSRGCLEYTPLTQPAEIKVVHSQNAEQELASILTEQINTPFAGAASHPLRWTVLQHRDGAAHDVIVCYRHVVADAAPICVLLAAVLRRYFDPGDGRTPPALTALAPADLRWLERPVRRHGGLRSVWRAARVFRQVHYAHRLKENKPRTNSTRVIVRPVEGLSLATLRQACRARRVNLSDAFMAALAAGIAEKTSQKNTRGRRRQLALGGVVSFRRHVRDTDDTYFGVALGDYVVLIEDPDLPLDKLVLQVAAQRRRQTPKQHTAESAACLALSRLLWPVFFKPNRRKTYRKVFPVCAGVSPFEVNLRTFGQTAGRIQRYVRASPPGPATPIVLAPTGFGDRLELALIHRPIDRGVGPAEGLLELVIANLRAFTSTEVEPRGATPARFSSGPADCPARPSL